MSLTGCRAGQNPQILTVVPPLLLLKFSREKVFQDLAYRLSAISFYKDFLKGLKNILCVLILILTIKAAYSAIKHYREIVLLPAVPLVLFLSNTK